MKFPCTLRDAAKHVREARDACPLWSACSKRCKIRAVRRQIAASSLSPRLRQPSHSSRRHLITSVPEIISTETTAAMANPHLGSRVASSSDRWILRRLKAPSRPGICPSRTESSRFRLTSVAELITPRQCEHLPPYVSPMSLLVIRKSAVLFCARSHWPGGYAKTSLILTAWERFRRFESAFQIVSVGVLAEGEIQQLFVASLVTSVDREPGLHAVYGVRPKARHAQFDGHFTEIFFLIGGRCFK